MRHAARRATRRVLIATAASVAILSAPTISLAQTRSSQAPPAPAANAPGAVEEIVVTAQLREQSLQEVPISAIVLSGRAVATQNLNNLETLTQSMPSVHVGLTPTAADIYIRGTGSGANPSFDQAAGTFIDGIYYGRSRISSATFFDLDHIELLKGPQSTFFGNNAIAGAFNIGTKAPGDTLSADARILYGSYGDRVAEAAVSGPITDDLAVRVAVHYDGTNGWLRNETAPNQASSGHVPAQDNVGARMTLLYKPTDSLSIKFKAEYSNNQSNGAGLQDTQCPPHSPLPASGFCLVELGLGFGGTVGLDKNIMTQNAGQGVRLQTEAEVLTANYAVAGLTLTSITGHIHYNYDQTLDIDGTPNFLGSAAAGEHYDQISQEFHVASPVGQPIEYLAGIYYQTDELAYNQQQSFPYLTPLVQSAPPFAPLVPLLPIAKLSNFGQQEWTIAAFGSLSWHVTDKLTLTGGLRETYDHKGFNNINEYGTATAQYSGFAPFPGVVNPQNNGAIVSTGLQGLASAIGLGPAGTEQGVGSYSALIPSAKVQYQVRPRVMAYFSYSEGFLAGGFNGLESTGITADAAYKPERVDDYELGVKSQLFDDRLVLNADLFYSKFTNFQVTQSVLQLGGVRNLVTNAASVITQGVEVDGAWRVTDDLRISGNVAYDDAYYGSYQNVAQNTLGTFCHTHVGNSACVSTYGGNGDPGATRNLTGQVTPFAPKWSGSVTAAYNIDAGSLMVTPSLTAVFSSSYFPSGSTLNDPVTEQGSYVRLDGQITLVKSGDSRWAIDLIGKNLTDADIIQTALLWPNTPGGAIEGKEEPRNVALQLRVHW